MNRPVLALNIIYHINYIIFLTAGCIYYIFKINVIDIFYKGGIRNTWNPPKSTISYQSRIGPPPNRSFFLFWYSIRDYIF